LPFIESFLIEKELFIVSTSFIPEAAKGPDKKAGRRFSHAPQAEKVLASLRWRRALGEEARDEAS